MTGSSTVSSTQLYTGDPARLATALSAPSSAVGRRACGRPRRGAVAAVLPHWSHDDDRLPGGRLTRALPPPANGHGRGAWCERQNRTASARWAPRSPGQPASGLHPYALVRAAFDHFDRDRRGLWVSLYASCSTHHAGRHRNSHWLQWGHSDQGQGGASPVAARPDAATFGKVCFGSPHRCMRRSRPRASSTCWW